MSTSRSSEVTVGLRDAATIAGVSVSTIRRWADEGRVPSFRTAGGHRRFRVADLQRALGTTTPSAGSAVDLFGAVAAEGIRRQLASPHGHHAEWLSGLDAQTHDRMRLLGRHLLTTIDEYLTNRRPRAAVVAEARQFGLLYGHEVASAGFSIRQAVEAFTFFRRGLEESARRHAAEQLLTAEARDDLRDQLDVVTDRVLLGIAEAYDGPGVTPPTPAAQ